MLTSETNINEIDIIYLSQATLSISKYVDIKSIQGSTLTFAAPCPVGQVRFNFHLPYSNFHLPLKKCMFYNVSFKTK